MPSEIIDTAYKVTEPGVIKAADDGTPIPIEATSLGRLVSGLKL